MIKKIIAKISAFFLLMCYSSLFGQHASSRLDSLFSSRGQDGMFNGNALIAQSGRIVYQQAFGYANLERKIRNTTASRSDLGSVSKLFTAVSVLQLKQKGRIKLSDPVIKYLPDFPYPNVTLRHLLTHTSGLPDFELFDPYYQADPHLIITNDDVIPALKKFGRLLFTPGEKWSYSSPGMAVLALIVERVSGERFEAYLKKHIWEPSGMSHTYINSLRAPVADPLRVDNYSSVNFFSDSLVHADTMQRHLQFSQVSGALLGPGLVVSDTKDLLAFDQALYSKRLLDAPTLQEAFTPIRLNDSSFARPEPWLGDTRFGLGWFILDNNPNGKIVLHTGKHAGVVTIFMRNLDTHQTIVLFDNADSYGLNNTALNTFNLLNNKAPVPLKKSIAKVYVRNLIACGADDAITHFHQFRADSIHYYLNVQEMDYAGHQLIDAGHQPQGLETLRLLTLIDATHSFPLYSYGRALQQCGKPDDAVIMYRQALTINPGDQEAKLALSRMLQLPK